MANLTSKREAISQVKWLIKKVHADNLLPNKLVWSLLKKHSAWLINRDNERMKLLRISNIFQTKKCIKVVEAPISDCCDINLDCTIYRTEEKLPEIYEDFSGPIIKSVKSIDGSQDVVITSAKDFERSSKNPYTKRLSKTKIKGYYGNGYIFFPEKHFKVIEVSAFFKDEISNEDCDICEECNDKNSKCKKFLDQEWRVPDYLKAQIIDYTFKDLLQAYVKLPSKAEEINKNDN